jgi:hypothetical protein
MNLTSKGIIGLAASLMLYGSALAQTVTPEHQRALLNAKQGQVVELPGLLSEKIPSLPYQKIVLPGPQFLISDDPEYVRVPEAIVLQERVNPGAVRLYVYNVNGIKEPKQIERKITAVFRNTSAYPVRLRMLRYASPAPSTNYFGIAKKALADYFASVPEATGRTVPPGASIPIDPLLEKRRVKYDELVHGFYEFVIDGEGEVSVLQTAPETPGTEALRRIKEVHPIGKKNAGRGSFGTSNYLVQAADTLLTSGEPVALVLADGKTDPWVVGTEGNSGSLSRLAGNYGVMYTVELKWRSTNGKGLALVTWNARAGDNKWCGGMANTVVVSGGRFKEGIIQLPSDQLRTKGAPEAILVQVFEPRGEGLQTIRLTYSPPGASCLPTPLVFIPVDLK